LIVDTAYRVSPLHRNDPDRLGRYWLTGRLGSGGMGVVYLGRDRHGELVAIKLIHAYLAHDPEFRGRFRSEIDRARQVPPFCTAEVLDADIDHDPPYLVVEYVDGPSLADVVEDNGPLKAAALHSLAVGVATALSGIHGAGVIHRDLKPDNVLLAPGSPKVIDFGIARAFEATSQHTRTDQMVGTVAYMAPERFSDAPGTPLTAAADIFSWGCVVAYAGTGMTPFHGDSPPATAARILTQEPYLEGLPAGLRAIVALTVQKDPAARPDARELLDMLLGNRPVPALGSPAKPAALPADPPVRRRPRRTVGHKLAAALAVLLVAAGVGTVGAIIAAGRAPGTVQKAFDSLGGNAAGTGTPRPTSTPSIPALQPDPAEPTGGEHIIEDPLSDEDEWQNSTVGAQRASCRLDGVMRVESRSRADYQCAGPTEFVENDFGVEVTASLLTAGSCAAVWLHWAESRGGHVLRVCQDEVVLADDMPGSSKVLGRTRLAGDLRLRDDVRVHVVARNGSVQIFLNGTFIDDVKVPESGPTGGAIKLGMSGGSSTAPSPYAVSFANVDIRSL
jgi:eukaryotic-like serine/threonine-protein kinase